MIGCLMDVEKVVEWQVARETEALRENMSQWHFVHHKHHFMRPAYVIICIKPVVKEPKF
jgi:hypothetical protein